MVQLLVVMNEKFWESTPPCLASVDRLARVEGSSSWGRRARGAGRMY